MSGDVKQSRTEDSSCRIAITCTSNLYEIVVIKDYAVEAEDDLYTVSILRTNEDAPDLTLPEALLLCMCGFENSFKAGDRSAIEWALWFCSEFRLPPPAWMSRQDLPGTWSRVQENKNRRKRTSVAVVCRVAELTKKITLTGSRVDRHGFVCHESELTRAEQAKPIDAGLFEEVGESAEFVISAGTASRRYCEIPDRQRQTLMNAHLYVLAALNSQNTSKD